MSLALADAHAAAEPAPAALIHSLLHEARVLALGGAHHAARRLCAETIAQWLPWLARDSALLQQAVASLLHAHGFEMVRRLLTACRGRNVHFRVVETELPDPEGGIGSRRLPDGSVLYLVHDSLLDGPGGERAVDEWAHRLLAEDRGRWGARAEPRPQLRHVAAAS